MNQPRRKRKKRKILSPEERVFRRKQSTLKNNIRNTFKRMGFEYLRTEGKHKIFDKQRGEFDSIYIYENIILLCEDSLDKNPKSHIKNKFVFYREVENNFDNVLNWLKSDYREKFNRFDDYPSSSPTLRVIKKHECKMLINNNIRSSFHSPKL